MKKLIVTGFLMLSLTNFSYSQFKKLAMENSQIKVEIMQTHHALNDALPLKSESVLREKLRDEFVFTSANGDKMDKETFLKNFALNPGVQISLLNTSEQHIVDIGQTAVLTGVLHIKLNIGPANESNEKDLWERITETYVNQAGTWNLLALQATYFKN